MTKIFKITPKSHPEIWAMLQPPEAQKPDTKTDQTQSQPTPLAK